MAEVRIDGQAHIFKIPNTHCRTRMNKKLHKKRKAEENEAKGLTYVWVSYVRGSDVRGLMFGVLMFGVQPRTSEIERSGFSDIAIALSMSLLMVFV